MANNPKSRHSKPTRKPVTLDLKAEKAPAEPETGKKTGAKVPAAEPVAFDFGEGSKRYKNTATNAVDRSAQGAVEGGTTRREAGKNEAGKNEIGKDEAGRSGAADTASEKAAAGTASATGGGGGEPPKTGSGGGGRPASRGGGMGFLGASLLGALMALAIAALLQWFGVIPSARNAVDLDPVEESLSTLRADVEKMQNAPPPGTPTEMQAQLDSASAATASSQKAIEAMKSTISELGQQVAALNDAVSSGGAGEGAGLEALTTRVSTVESALSALNDRIDQSGGTAEAVSQLQQVVNGLSKDMQQMRQSADGASGALDQRLAPMDQRLADLAASIKDIENRLTAVEKDIDSGAGSRVAAAIAASSLKSAVDRGGSFMTELESFAAVGGSTQSVEALRQYAASGVPTLAQLNARYPQVANRIVASTSGVGADAGIGERLMASARSLVTVRPVGEVEGDTSGAIAARMEVALKQGDLQKFLDEWKTLPDAAQSASKDFADDVRARAKVDNLIGDVLTGAMEQAAPAASNGGQSGQADQPAAQSGQSTQGE